MVRAIVGANWGDEGKGKITDMLAKESDIIVRFQGGSNAGHTIINNYGKFALHLLPSGVFYDHTTSIIGNGVALNIPYLIDEINSVVERGVPKPRILVSDRAQVLMPYHVLFDTYEEARLAGKSFGSTKSGIAPFYSDKYAKIGIQVSELFDDEVIKEKIGRVCETKNVLLEHLYHKPLLDPEELLETCRQYRDMVAPYVCDVSAYLHQAIKEGKTILLEGQLGSLKDTDHGIYPMVTSSSTLAAYGAIGAGIPPYEIKDIITVVKAYSSAVGAGAFVSEIFGGEADELRRLVLLQVPPGPVLTLPHSDFPQIGAGARLQAMGAPERPGGGLGAEQVAGVDRVDGFPRETALQGGDLAVAVVGNQAVIPAVDAAVEIALRFCMADDIEFGHRCDFSLFGGFGAGCFLLSGISPEIRGGLGPVAPQRVVYHLLKGL